MCLKMHCRIYATRILFYIKFKKKIIYLKKEKISGRNLLSNLIFNVQTSPALTHMDRLYSVFSVLYFMADMMRRC